MNYPYYIAADNSKVKIEDATVLNNIARNKNQTQYVRIQMLNLQDLPIENGVIHGRVTGGNISLNSTSPVRRSGSLSLVADETNCDITSLENIIAINKRAQIEIGLKNDFGLSIPAKDNKIWFSLGVFVLTNANINKSLSGLNISVNLKDKMALLNGECGGVIYTIVTHSPLYKEDGTVEPAPFKALIKSLVRDWGKIPEAKIQISDIKDFIENTYSWSGAQPLYIGTSLGADGKPIPQYVSLTSRPESATITQNMFLTRESVGYSYKKSAYPGTLTSAVGETVTSVLDKIKKTLGNYEYFFDIDGNFIFRKIPNYLDEGSAMDNLADAFGEGYLTVSTNDEKAQFDFQNEELIISCSNQPKYEAIKNDYVVWGAKGESKIPIRYHLVIDNKPSGFIKGNYDCKLYTDDFGVVRALPLNSTLAGATSGTMNVQDWRAWLYYDYVVNGKYNDYGQELKEEFPKQYNLTEGQYYHEQGVIDNEKKAKLYDLVYWLDFLDPNDIVNEVDGDGKTIVDKSSVKNALNAISVTNIGRKTKTVKDESINCIFNIRPLDILLIPASTSDTAAMREAAGATPYYQIGPDISKKMSLTGWNNAAYDTIRAVIHETTAYNNVISLTSIPIFHLEPSMRVKVNITEGGKPIAVGHYMINSLSVPLAYNGNMTINASRAIERI